MRTFDSLKLSMLTLSALTHVCPEQSCIELFWNMALPEIYKHVRPKHCYDKIKVGTVHVRPKHCYDKIKVGTGLQNS